MTVPTDRAKNFINLRYFSVNMHLNRRQMIKKYLSALVLFTLIFGALMLSGCIETSEKPSNEGASSSAWFYNIKSVSILTKHPYTQQSGYWLVVDADAPQPPPLHELEKWLTKLVVKIETGVSESLICEFELEYSAKSVLVPPPESIDPYYDNEVITFPIVGRSYRTHLLFTFSDNSTLPWDGIVECKNP